MILGDPNNDVSVVLRVLESALGTLLMMLEMILETLITTLGLY